MKKIVAFLMLTSIFFTQSDAQNIFPPTGNAGIGTLNPDAPLTIFSSGRRGLGGFPRIRLKNNNSNNNGRYWDISAFIANGATSDDRLTISNKGKANLLTITGSGNIGIGTSNPGFPLSFESAFGKKISLFHNNNNNSDAGFGILSNRLLIFADNNQSDVAMGFEDNGVFQERFAVKPTGALAVMSNTGLRGQVLTSNGPNSPAEWKTPPSLKFCTVCTSVEPGGTVMAGSTRPLGVIFFEVAGDNAQVLVNFQLMVGSGNPCFLCGEASGFADVLLDDNPVAVSRVILTTSSTAPIVSGAGSVLLLVPKGINHKIILRATNSSKRDMTILGNGIGGSSFSVLVIPDPR
jgi:hypothetical protein